MVAEGVVEDVEGAEAFRHRCAISGCRRSSDEKGRSFVAPSSDGPDISRRAGTDAAAATACRNL